MSKVLRLETVRIKRTKNSNWETMININEGTGPLIDMDGKIVKGPIWKGIDLNEQVMTITENE